MKFLERKEFLYDTQVFSRCDTQTAMKIHAEYVYRHSRQPYPKFFEVDRDSAEIDSLWHSPKDDRRIKFSREISLPAINVFEKPDWRLTRLGIVPQRRDKFWLSHAHLEAADYFPVRGDLVYHDGYRYMILNVVLDPTSYWHQTNVWLGLVVECIIPLEGDERSVLNPGKSAPAEKAPGFKIVGDEV